MRIFIKFTYYIRIMRLKKLKYLKFSMQKMEKIKFDVKASHFFSKAVTYNTFSIVKTIIF